jgi:hypothetical protein
MSLEYSEFVCPICGRFRVGLTLVRTPTFQQHPELAPYLSAHLRQSNLKNVVPQIELKNWQSLASVHARTPVHEKVNLVLTEISRQGPIPGDRASIDGNVDYPLFDARGIEEIRFLINTLYAKGWIEKPVVSHSAQWDALLLTMEGWIQVEALLSENRDSNTCFVAMSFDKSLVSVYDDAILPAITECKFRPDRVDQLEFNNKICDEIIVGIRKSRFVVADFTGHRGGVYFEAGFALGLGCPVIFTCRDTDIDQAHFDTNHYNHIVWQTPADLRLKLVNRIEATIDH